MHADARILPNKQTPCTHTFLLTRAHLASRWIRGEVQKNNNCHKHYQIDYSSQSALSTHIIKVTTLRSQHDRQQDRGHTTEDPLSRKDPEHEEPRTRKPMNGETNRNSYARDPSLQTPRQLNGNPSPAGLSGKSFTETRRKLNVDGAYGAVLAAARQRQTDNRRQTRQQQGRYSRSIPRMLAELCRCLMYTVPTCMHATCHTHTYTQRCPGFSPGQARGKPWTPHRFKQRSRSRTAHL